jgi:hypothetical protein
MFKLAGMAVAIVSLCILSLLAIRYVRRLTRNAETGPAPHCLDCGYSLKGCGSARCPECGARRRHNTRECESTIWTVVGGGVWYGTIFGLIIAWLILPSVSHLRYSQQVVGPQSKSYVSMTLRRDIKVYNTPFRWIRKSEKEETIVLELIDLVNERHTLRWDVSGRGCYMVSPRHQEFHRPGRPDVPMIAEYFRGAGINTDDPTVTREIDEAHSEVAQAAVGASTGEWGQLFHISSPGEWENSMYPSRQQFVFGGIWAVLLAVLAIALRAHLAKRVKEAQS